MCTALVSVCKHYVPETKIMTQTGTLYSLLLPCITAKKEWNFTSVSTIHLYGARTFAFYLQNQILGLSADKTNLLTL
jgi:hypothetical protein